VHPGHGRWHQPGEVAGQGEGSCHTGVLCSDRVMPPLRLVMVRLFTASCMHTGKFPKSVCTSVNECVCHGIPDDRPLEDGDIVNIDVTVSPVNSRLYGCGCLP
jgi:hypothetical protein